MLLAYLGCLDTTPRADGRRVEVNADMNEAAIMAVRAGGPRSGAEGTASYHVIGEREEGGEVRVHKNTS